MSLLKTHVNYSILSMKKIINGIIVVEGSNDVSLLSSIINSEFVSLNGLELKNIKYLKKVSSLKPIYLLTDPDEEGKRIRAKVKNIIPTCIDIEIDINKCNKNNKKGVAECDIEEIYRVFSNYWNDELTCYKNNEIEQLLLELRSDKNSKSIRESICKKIDIENCNQKTFEQRIKSLQISREEIDN